MMLQLTLNPCFVACFKAPKLQGRALASFVCKLYRAISGDGISTKLAASALEEAPLNTPHLQLALDVVRFADAVED